MVDSAATMPAAPTFSERANATERPAPRQQVQRSVATAFEHAPYRSCADSWICNPCPPRFRAAVAAAPPGRPTSKFSRIANFELDCRAALHRELANPASHRSFTVRNHSMPENRFSEHLRSWSPASAQVNFTVELPGTRRAVAAGNPVDSWLSQFVFLLLRLETRVLAAAARQAGDQGPTA